MSYEPDEEWMNASLGKPAKPSPATMGFNSAVIKPETRANKAEDAEQPSQQECDVAMVEGFEHSISEQPKTCNCVESRHLEGAIACPDCAEIEQPNLKIIEEIEGLMSQVNNKLDKLDVGSVKEDAMPKKYKARAEAYEEIDLFRKTTLFNLRKVFE